MQCRGGGLKGLTVQTVGSETGEDLSDRILIAENRCAALFVSTVSPDSETAALQCGRPVSIVPPFTHPDTWPRQIRNVISSSRIAWAESSFDWAVGLHEAQAAGQ
jgi:hypothetical protein